MEFRVKFTPKNASAWIYRVQAKSLGLRALDAARKISGQHIPPENLSENVPGDFTAFITVKISESIARSLGERFLDSPLTRVVVDGQLNQYVYLRLHYDARSDQYFFAYEFDRESLLSDWLAQGAPEEIDASRLPGTDKVFAGPVIRENELEED